MIAATQAGTKSAAWLALSAVLEVLAVNERAARRW